MIRKVLISLIVVAIAVVAWFMHGIFGPDPVIVVSIETTWLTEPLADDGLPDYAKWLLDQQREGVTPENNAAIPLLQAMWTENVFQPHAELVFREIGMDEPESNGEFANLLGASLADPMLLQMSLHVLEQEGIVREEPINDRADYILWLEEWEQEHGPFVSEEESWGMLEADIDLDDPNVSPFDRADAIVFEIGERIATQPWTREQFPPLAHWVDHHANDFALLYEAARRERWYCPSPTLLATPKAPLMAMLLPGVDLIDGASQLLAVRAMMHVGEHDVASAWRDARTMHLLAEHIPQRSLVEQMVRIRLHRVANDAVTAILMSPAVDTATAQAIGDFYGNHPVEYSLAKSLDQSERLSYLTTVIAFSGHRRDSDTSFEDFAGELSLARSMVSVDWNVALTEGNDWFDRFGRASGINDCAERHAAFEEIVAELETIAAATQVQPTNLFDRESRSERMSSILITTLMPGAWATIETGERSLAEHQLIRVAAALTIYRCEHGEYPNSLDVLVPDLLSELPQDDYTGAPIAYTKTTDGYLLVNLGPNGVDDGGSNSQRDIYKGISLGYEEDKDNATAMEFLGEEVPRDADGEIDFLELAPPADADDIALRMPQPPAEWPLMPQSSE